MPFSIKTTWNTTRANCQAVYDSATSYTGYSNSTPSTAPPHTAPPNTTTRTAPRTESPTAPPTRAPPTTAASNPLPIAAAPIQYPAPESPPPSWTTHDIIRRSRNPSGETSAKKDWNSDWFLMEHNMAPPVPKSTTRQQRRRRAYSPPSTAIPNDTRNRSFSPDAKYFLATSPPSPVHPTRPVASDLDSSVKVITKDHDINLALHAITLELMQSHPSMPPLGHVSKQEEERMKAKWYGKMAEEARGMIKESGIQLDAMELNIFLKCVMVAWEEEGKKKKEKKERKGKDKGMGKGREEEWEKGIEYEWERERQELEDDTEVIFMGKASGVC